MGLQRPTSRTARQALAWALLCLVSVQGAGRLVLWLRPEVGDPEFGRKQTDLRTLVAADPQRTLVLALGSSRMATGFRPDALQNILNDSRPSIIVYNFAQVGTGPEMSLLSLHRLVSRGIRPDWVLVEFWPPIWAVSRSQNEFSIEIDLGRLDWTSVRLLARYVPQPRRLYRTWLSAQLFPLYARRYTLRRSLASSLHLVAAETDRRCRNLDGHGWWCPVQSTEPAERDRLAKQFRPVYEPRLQTFHIESGPDRALRELIALCRREKILATLVILPEGDAFRRLYPPSALRGVADYLATLQHETGVGVVDARTWVGDDGFMDGHHLLPSGATVFTRRLGREVLEPQLEVFETRLRTGQPVGPAAPQPLGRQTRIDHPEFGVGGRAGANNRE